MRRAALISDNFAIFTIFLGSWQGSGPAGTAVLEHIMAGNAKKNELDRQERSSWVARAVQQLLANNGPSMMAWIALVSYVSEPDT